MGAGIYPGVSNVMAAHMVSIARREYNADWTYASAATGTGRLASAASSASSSTANQELEAVPLRSGVATLEPNEGAACPQRKFYWGSMMRPSAELLLSHSSHEHPSQLKELDQGLEN